MRLEIHSTEELRSLSSKLSTVPKGTLGNGEGSTAFYNFLYSRFTMQKNSPYPHYLASHIIECCRTPAMSLGRIIPEVQGIDLQELAHMCARE